MSYRSRYTKSSAFRCRRFHLDSVRGKLGGVCAGLSNYIKVPVGFVRIAALLALLFGTGVTLLAYGIAYAVSDDRPSLSEY